MKLSPRYSGHVGSCLVFIFSMISFSCLKKVDPLVKINREKPQIAQIDASMADYWVNDYSALKSALDQATDGQVVYVDESSNIDLTGKEGTLILKGGVSLVSNRNGSDLNGALLFSDSQYLIQNDKQFKPLLVVSGDNCHISGLRIKGADTAANVDLVTRLVEQGGEQAQYTLPLCRGIEIYGKNFVFDRCELYGWTHAGLEFEIGSEGTVNDNYIHHNQRELLGYGIELDGAKAVIFNNLFDYNRHSITGSGIQGSGYEAYNNTILGHCISYAFDMHGGDDRDDGTDLAGDFVSIHDNSFYLWEKRAILINGVPSQELSIEKNQFLENTPCEAMQFRVPNASEFACDCDTVRNQGGIVPEYYNVGNNTFNISLSLMPRAPSSFYSRSKHL